MDLVPIISEKELNDLVNKNLTLDEFCQILRDEYGVRQLTYPHHIINRIINNRRVTVWTEENTYIGDELVIKAKVG